MKCRQNISAVNQKSNLSIGDSLSTPFGNEKSGSILRSRGVSNGDSQHRCKNKEMAETKLEHREPDWKQPKSVNRFAAVGFDP